MVIRNLLFHCYPIRGTVWPWHISQLLAYKSVWNGRRLVILALDERTVSESEARAHFEPLGAEILVKRNNIHLAETAYFTETLGMLESKRADEATFYAHAKGVTRTQPTQEPVRRWSELMYRATLSFPKVIDKRLSKAGTVGCLRWTHLPHVLPFRAGWCWAGTFFWMRHDLLFSRDWRRIACQVYGVEDYPSWQFSEDESSCLTREQILPHDLYYGAIDEAFTRETMQALRTENKGL
jgi:hypothetical protein